mmetsp:Transcript_64403/g.112448  ORF Transcript_64403/g.112448 Transcript_64403/m.112448 type:complete len:573 (+) Transcript_64403:84-1802(+)
MAGTGFGESPPEIFTGSYFDQANIVSQTEGLQDFRRRQEGHLIIADDRPLLVMSFGTQYTGTNSAKYKIEGKYDIPISYKVIIKWDEDEIVFMTRQGTFGPEFQIVYLPKSPVPEDFTLFEWNANIAELWDQFLTVVEGKEERDMRMFTLGPWRTFGVTRDEVQIALKRGTDSEKVDGILYCAEGVWPPTLEEHMRYLQFDPTTDEAYVWVCRAFMDEPEPAHVRHWMHEGMCFWEDTRNGDRTYNHPHLEKYKKMLHVARQQKPLPHWKAIMEFRIEFLLSGIFTWECELSGVYPPVETVENVIEMAHIFGISIKDEPYLVHVLKRALRHYGTVVKEKKKVKDVGDFRNLMARYRDIVQQFERTKNEETRRIQDMKVCVQCPEENPKDAVLFCDQCRDFLCQGCFERLHSTGRRKNHRRTWVEMGMCAECQESIALFHCVQCSDLYCRDCFQEWHVRGGRRNHIPIVLRSINSQTKVLPDALPAMGTGAGLQISKAKSPWFAFVDEDNVKLYYNIATGVTFRDMPLAVINEPIEDNVGGGMTGGWAGTWGANMFSDPLDDAENQVELEGNI